MREIQELLSAIKKNRREVRGAPRVTLLPHRHRHHDHLLLHHHHGVLTHRYAELVGNIMVDCESSRKYYHFIRLMGREASHLTLEVALRTMPNLVFIGEEVRQHGANTLILTRTLA